MNKYGLGKMPEKEEEAINVDNSQPASASKVKAKVAGSKIVPKKHQSPKLSPKAKGKKKSITPTKKTNNSPRPKKCPPSVSPKTKDKSVKGPPTKRKNRRTPIIAI